MSNQPHNRMETQYSESEAEPRQWQRQMQRCQGAIEQSVQENPLAATLGAFGIGLGLGAVIGSLLVSPADRRREHLAKSLGRRLLDSAADIMPHSIEKHLR